MIKLNSDISKILAERFGKDNLIALATVENGIPQVRAVNAYYDNGAFYVITHAKSNKMRQLAQNSTAAIAADWFTCHATGENLGWYRKDENREIAEKLRNAFSEWIDNGHNDFSDENTCILRLEITDGVLFNHGIKYEL